jgi:hypothetical protein
MAETSREPSKNLTDTTRVVFKSILDPIGKFLNRLGLMPNHLTLLGVLGNIIGTYFVAIGQMTIGGIIILLMGPIDALDGTMARLRGMSSKFGAFVDSVSDLYSELIIFGGFIYSCKRAVSRVGYKSRNPHPNGKISCFISGINPDFCIWRDCSNHRNCYNRYIC